MSWWPESLCGVHTVQYVPMCPLKVGGRDSAERVPLTPDLYCKMYGSALRHHAVPKTPPTFPAGAPSYFRATRTAGFGRKSPNGRNTNDRYRV